MWTHAFATAENMIFKSWAPVENPQVNTAEPALVRRRCISTLQPFPQPLHMSTAESAFVSGHFTLRLLSANITTRTLSSIHPSWRQDSLAPLRPAPRRRTRVRALNVRACQSPDSSSANSSSVDSTTESQPPNVDDVTDDSTQDGTSFRFMRKLLVALSLTGMAETLFLTLNKVLSDPGAICGTQGCLDVLSGPFSSFLGIPLTLFGVLSYSLLAYLSAWPLSASDEIRSVKSTDDDTSTIQETIPAEQVYLTRDAATRPILLWLSTAQFVYSMYLLGILLFLIKSMCPYCLFSAALSTVIFVLTAFVGKAVPSPKTALGIGSTAVAVSSVFAAALFFVSWPSHILAQPPSEPQAPPAVTASSTSDSMVRSLHII